MPHRTFDMASLEPLELQIADFTVWQSYTSAEPHPVIDDSHSGGESATAEIRATELKEFTDMGESLGAFYRQSPISCDDEGSDEFTPPWWLSEDLASDPCRPITIRDPETDIESSETGVEELFGTVESPWAEFSQSPSGERLVASLDPEISPPSGPPTAELELPPTDDRDDDRAIESSYTSFPGPPKSVNRHPTRKSKRLANNRLAQTRHRKKFASAMERLKTLVRTDRNSVDTRLKVVEEACAVIKDLRKRVKKC